MLVCNVSQRAARRAIAAEIAEAGAAVDDPGSGQVVFATLVDDPASVGEIVDAYLGEIMLEAASAAEVINSGLTYEAVISETMSANSVQDATVTAAPTGATWDPATVANVTLSNGNLTATNTGTTSADQGARVATSAGKTSGKIYFEATYINTVPGGGNVGIGVGTTASTYTTMGNGGGVTGAHVYTSMNIWANGSNTGINIGSFVTNPLYCVAVDLDNRKIWFRLGASGNWNNNASFNPATNTGGVTLAAGTMVPFCTFGGSVGQSNRAWVANFGGSTFTGAVPSGFTSGWL